MKVSKRVRGEKNFNALFYTLLRDAERAILRDFLVSTDWVQKDAAELLGMDAAHLGRRIKALGGVLPDDPRKEPFVPDEKRQDDDHTAEVDDDDQGRSDDGSDGETDRADASKN